MSYRRSAPYYDVIYGSKDYQSESARVHHLVQQTCSSGGHSLLDVACGTGRHDEYLRQWYEVEGLDISAAQLAIARVRLPMVKFYKDDMVSFKLLRAYDVVTCLFSAIGHVTSIHAMRKAVANMADHVKPGGVLLIEPWLHPYKFDPDHMGAEVGDAPDVKVLRATEIWAVGQLTHLKMHHLVIRPRLAVEYFVEEHQLAMYTEEQYMDAFKAAGLEPVHDLDGLGPRSRGLFIGIKPF